MRCELQMCRGILSERIDRLGRITFVCDQCARRKRGVCRDCPRPVYGKVGTAFYCNECRVARRRVYVMRWQKNNLAKVAEGQRRRRYKAMGKPVPKRKMSPSEAGKLGGPLAAAARLASLSPERIKEIAKKARETRWRKYRERKQRESQ